jgi:hypothetical protein
MVNQQATPFEVGWFLGILEGEGSLGLYWNQARKQIYPTCTIVNTEHGIIEEALRIVNLMGVGGYVKQYDRKHLRPEAQHWKDRWDFYVWGIKRTHGLLSVLLPVWTCPTLKRTKAGLIMEFCQSRLGKPANSLGRYCESEVQIYERFCALNGKSPETTRALRTVAE